MYAGAVRLSVGREVKTEIPVQYFCTTHRLKIDSVAPLARIAPGSTLDEELRGGVPWP
jgi:hypothetical protein